MNWVVVDEETNVTCIVVKLAASFVVPFHTISGQVIVKCYILIGLFQTIDFFL
jgi:hypothetical protein